MKKRGLIAAVLPVAFAVSTVSAFAWQLPRCSASNLTANSSGTLLFSNSEMNYPLYVGQDSGSAERGFTSVRRIGAITFKHPYLRDALDDWTIAAVHIIDTKNWSPLVTFAYRDSATDVVTAPRSYFWAGDGGVTSIDVAMSNVLSLAQSPETNGFAYLAEGEITPVAEPATWIAAAIACFFIICHVARRIAGAVLKGGARPRLNSLAVHTV
jgi:hypothetical protein